MKPKILDIAAVLAVILLAVMCALPLLAGRDGSTLTVTTDTETYTLSLGHDAVHEIKSNSHTLTLTVKNGEARVTAHTCPDGLCAATGAISHASEAIVCLPAKVSIRVTQDSEVLDGIVG